jgi:hypothetical protein
MPRRGDYRHREPKKPKKGDKKLPQVNILRTPSDVEIIKKERKKRQGEETET